MSPQTTVLIPSYNCGRYLKECIDSVLSQGYKSFELLIIDDGSTDNTSEVIGSISDPRIVYVKNRKNLGIVRTLNKGIGLARGKYIARMDADDVMLCNRLEEQVNFLDARPDYGMVGSWYVVMDESGKQIDTVKRSTDHSFLSLALIFGNQFAHSAVTIRTDLASELKYSGDFPHCEDHDMWIRVAERSRATNLPAFHLSYRSHATSTCGLNQRELKISVIKLLSRELDKIGVDHSIEELMLHAAVCFGASGRLLKKEGKLKDLENWYDKIFASEVLAQRYSCEWLRQFRSEILKMYCGIDP